MTEPMQATMDDYIATLATMSLIRSGCNSFPVDTLNLLRHMAKIGREGNSIVLQKDEVGYTILIPEDVPLDRYLCASLILDILLDSLGIKYHDENERKHAVFVFACHLLCPRQIFRLTDRTWTSISFLESFLGIPRHLIRSLPRCPSCYVPRDMNMQLLSLFRQQYRSLYVQDRANEIALRKYLTGYEDDEYCLEKRPEIHTEKMREAMASLIPEYVLTKGHPASLFIEYTEDFETFSCQFGTLDLEILYRLIFDEDPPLPLFGGKPKKGTKDYAVRIEKYFSRESSVRLAIANLLFQQKYRPEEADILAASIRRLYESI